MYDEDPFGDGERWVFNEETQRWVAIDPETEDEITYHMGSSGPMRGRELRPSSDAADLLRRAAPGARLEADRAIKVELTPRLALWGLWSARLAGVFLSKWLAWFVVCRWIGFFFLRRAFFFSNGEIPVRIEGGHGRRRDRGSIR
jgi:hypothetical protein